MTTLLVGFDSAWTATNSGALVGVLRAHDGTYQELGPPLVVNYGQAECTILEWQAQHHPAATIVLLDQPTIVKNARGQRPVENLVSSPVSLRYGGMQPANTSKREMFGEGAPVWRFLTKFGGPANPTESGKEMQVFETYPVLTMIALGWSLSDPHRAAGRLPKYNPTRRTFSKSDWRHVCLRARDVLAVHGLPLLVQWLDAAEKIEAPRKSNQDGLDACICLLAALYFAEAKDCLMVGNLDTGYIVVPYEEALSYELMGRCRKTQRDPAQWVRSFRAEL